MDFANRTLARLGRFPAAIGRLLADRRRVAPWASGILLLCLWIAWTIHVGNANGWNAAVGVLITWPLLAATIALLAMIASGIHRFVQRRRVPAFPAIAGAGPPPKLPKGHDSVTTLTFPS